MKLKNYYQKMLKSQIAKLDRLWQQKVCEQPSLLGGVAQVAHHWVRRSEMATRWWLPNGCPLTHIQHQDIESKNGHEIKCRILEVKGLKWHLDLWYRSARVAKNIKYQNVVDYLSGKREDYL